MPNILKPETYKTPSNTWAQAFQLMYAAGTHGDVFEFAPFTYDLDSPLTFESLTGCSFIGTGSATEWRYTGGAAAAFITFGGVTSPNPQVSGQLVSDIRITAASSLTAGCAVKVRNVVNSTFARVYVDGADGTTWFSGWHFDEVAYVALENGGSITVKNDAITLNGKNNVVGAEAGFFLTDTKITGVNGIGIHIAGAFGGTYLNGVDIIRCKKGMVIDDALRTGFPNREVMLSDTVSIDGNTLVGLYVDQPESNFYLQLGNAWICSTNSGPAVHIKRAPNIRICGGAYLYNNTGDGFLNEEPKAYGHPRLHAQNNGGWGFSDLAGQSSRLNPVVFGSNNSGDLNQPFAPLTRDHMTRIDMRDLHLTEGWSIGNPESASTFSARVDGSGDPILNFDQGQYARYDRYWDAFKVHVSGKTVLTAGEHGTIFRATQGAMPLTEAGQVGLYQISNTQLRLVLMGNDLVPRILDFPLS